MPQISASVNENTVKAIHSIRKLEKRSFSEAVDKLLETHPMVVFELEKIKSKSKK